MTGRSSRNTRGYTIVELLLVVGVIPILLAAVGNVFVSSEGLVQKSRANLRAHEELRRNLEAIANVVRDADIDTVGGFDDTGWACQPTFAKVVGADLTDRIYEGPQQLRWVPTAQDVDDVASPGAVVHVNDGTTRIVATRVPEGGFKVRLEGGRLKIRMSTYYATSARQLAQVTGETSVALRN